MESCPVLAGYDPLAPDERRDPYPSFARAHREAPVLALVDARRRAPRDDFASVLAAYRHPDGSSPTDEDIAAQIHTILGAGFETSAQLMSYGVRSMLEQRDQWELLQADPAPLPGAVEECARHRTLVWAA